MPLPVVPAQAVLPHQVRQQAEVFLGVRAQARQLALAQVHVRVQLQGRRMKMKLSIP